MLVKVLDRLILLASLYFLYMILFHLPRHCDPPKQTPASPSESFFPFSPTYPHDNPQTICPDNDEADKIMKRFLAIQNKNLDTIKNGGKFVIYSATDAAGFGNRIPALLSSFMLALVLERGFLVHWPNVAQKNISDKFDESSMVMPVFSDLFLPPVPIDILAIPSYFTFFDDESAVAVKLDDAAELLLCTDIEKEFDDRQFIVVRGYRAFFDLLSHNSFLESRITQLGLDTSVIRALATCLLRPVPEVYEMVREFGEENHISSKQKLIGIHIRKHARQGLTDKEQEGLWSCVRKKYPPPNLWKDAWDGQEAKSETVTKEDAPYLYFLASDSESTIDLVPPEFLPYVVRLSGGIGRTTASGILRALADIWILGHSVEIYGAQGTTFLNAVRTLFPSKANLEAVGGKKVDKYCRAVGDLPCFKWWDIFQSKAQPNFSISCFTPTGTNTVLC